MADPTAARARPQMRGVYPVLVTPFDEHGEVDLAGLERCVAFCLEAGAHGVVALVNASEFTTLSDAERSRIADRVVRAVAGQVPVVLGVSAGTARLAAGYAVEARTAGADAVIAMPPFVRAASSPAGPRLLPGDRGRLGSARVHPELPRVSRGPAHGRCRHRARVLDRRRQLREGGGAAGWPAA